MVDLLQDFSAFSAHLVHTIWKNEQEYKAPREGGVPGELPLEFLSLGFYMSSFAEQA